MYVDVEKETFEAEKEECKRGAERTPRPALDTYDHPTVRWQVLPFTAVQERMVPGVSEALDIPAWGQSRPALKKEAQRWRSPHTGTCTTYVLVPG